MGKLAIPIGVSCQCSVCGERRSYLLSLIEQFGVYCVLCCNCFLKLEALRRAGRFYPKYLTRMERLFVSRLLRTSANGCSRLRRAWRCRELARRYKKRKGCRICGERDADKLTFHHRDPGRKLEKIGRLISKGRYRALVEEIRKCEILCGNCHRMVHGGEIFCAKNR